MHKESYQREVTHHLRQPLFEEQAEILQSPDTLLSLSRQQETPEDGGARTESTVHPSDDSSYPFTRKKKELEKEPSFTSSKKEKNEEILYTRNQVEDFHPSNNSFETVQKDENLQSSSNYSTETIRKPSLVKKIKAFFGVTKPLNEIKVYVTKEAFLKKSVEVGKKGLHKKNLVPVIIWDFGGQDVFYSTHQTFLTYRALYILVVDGNRNLDDPCLFEQYLPGKAGAKTPRGIFC